MAKKKNTRIILTGAQGTGKTTLMNALAKDGIKTLSIARETAVETGWTPEQGHTEEYQKKLYSNMRKALSSKKSYISDRGLSCVAAYTFSSALDGNIAKEVADGQYMELVEFHNDNPDVLLAYLPVEFEIEPDGVRNVDPDDQAKIDFLIKNILETSGVNYITVTGTVEERVKQIENALNKQ